MKIGLTGSHSTGKTTLAKEVAIDLDICLIKEKAREVINEWDFIPHTRPIKERVGFQDEVMARQIQAELKYKDVSFITDRTGYDCLGYTKNQGLPNYKHLKQKFKKHNKENPYDYVILLPIAFPIEDDGVRLVDLEYQYSIDNAIKECLEDMDQSYIVMPGNTSVEERVKFVKKIIS